jgi:N-acetylglutamate synthase-like GNAT family acetyltransferase
MLIRRSVETDVAAIAAVINEAAQAYRGVIPADRWHEPYMPAEELEREISDGVVFWVAEQDGRVSGVMGIQDKGDVALVRHAYVAPGAQRSGVGRSLLRHVEGLTEKPMLIGTWAAASWAIRFYQRNGYTVVPEGERDRLLRTYWSIPVRQIETSVVLADRRWMEDRRATSTTDRERPPAILQIYRDLPRTGREDAFRAVEEDAARACAELGFPHAHLALESLGGPHEVWWLNAFDSEADRQQVTRDYEGNLALVRALEEIGRRRHDLVEAPVDVLARYRADLSRGDTWRIAGARFFVVKVTRDDPRLVATVFEAPDGTRYALRPAGTRSEAERLAGEAGLGVTIFAVRPYWGMAAKEWVAADPDFWRINPAARGGGA